MNLLSIYAGSKLFNESYDNLYFDKKHIEFSMSNYFFDKYYKEIEECKEIYSNYYLIRKYATNIPSYKYVGLLEFLSILIEVYPYTMDILMNTYKISVLDIYNILESDLNELTIYEKENLLYRMNENRIDEIIYFNKLSLNTEIIKSVYKYDNLLNDLFSKSIEDAKSIFWDIIESRVNLAENIVVSEINRYLIVAINSGISVILLEKEDYNYLSNLKNIDNNTQLFKRYLDDNYGRLIGGEL